MKDELTDEMHATFWVDEETDKMHRVWAVCRNVEDGSFTLEDGLRFSSLTLADFDKYHERWPG